MDFVVAWQYKARFKRNDNEEVKEPRGRRTAGQPLAKLTTTVGSGCGLTSSHELRRGGVLHAQPLHTDTPPKSSGSPWLQPEIDGRTLYETG